MGEVAWEQKRKRQMWDPNSRQQLTEEGNWWVRKSKQDRGITGDYFAYGMTLYKDRLFLTWNIGSMPCCTHTDLSLLLLSLTESPCLHCPSSWGLVLAESLAHKSELTRSLCLLLACQSGALKKTSVRKEQYIFFKFSNRPLRMNF